MVETEEFLRTKVQAEIITIDNCYILDYIAGDMSSQNSVNRYRAAQINVRVTEQEKVWLRHQANNHDMTVSEYFRRLAFEDDFRLEHARYEGLLVSRLKHEGRL